MLFGKMRKNSDGRKKEARPEAGGGISIIDTTKIPTPDEMAKFRIMGTAYYNFGRKDKANAAEALTHDEFVRVFSLRDWKRTNPEDIPSELTQAQYEQYMAGYKGEAYHDLIFRKISE